MWSCGFPGSQIKRKDRLSKYCIFCTNLNGKAHEVIETYDKRAEMGNLVSEAKREGLDAIPSGKFKNNYAFFQTAMPAYNLCHFLDRLRSEKLQECNA